MIKEFEIEFDDRLWIEGEAGWECEDVGIGPYEFWGAKGYDSRMEYRVEWVKISAIDGVPIKDFVNFGEVVFKECHLKDANDLTSTDIKKIRMKELEDWARAYLDNTECEWPTEKDEPEPPRYRDERDEPSYTRHPYYEVER